METEKEKNTHKWPEPKSKDEMYCYTFALWVTEFNRCKGITKVLKMYGMVEMEFTEKDFNELRADLECHGYSLREISRKPYFEEEVVL